MCALLGAARAIIACPHPRDQVQTFSIDKADAGAPFPPRPLVIDRCQQCGAVRMHGDLWIATLGAADLARQLGPFEAPSPVLEALAERWGQVRVAGGCAFGIEWHPSSFPPIDTVRPADDIPLPDLFAYDCAASGCLPPQAGVPVHAPHLRTLLAAYLVVQIAAIVTTNSDEAAAPRSGMRARPTPCRARAGAVRS